MVSSPPPSENITIILHASVVEDFPSFLDPSGSQAMEQHEGLHKVNLPDSARYQQGRFRLARRKNFLMVMRVRSWRRFRRLQAICGWCVSEQAGPRQQEWWWRRSWAVAWGKEREQMTLWLLAAWCWEMSAANFTCLAAQKCLQVAKIF